MVTQEEALVKVKTWPLLPEASLLLATLFWGLTFILTKQALVFSGPFTFLTFRCILALPLLMTWKASEQRKGLTPASLREGVATGLTLFGAFALQTMGLQYTSATNTSLLTGIYVVLIPFLALLLLREKIFLYAWIGIGLSGVGVVVMAGNASSWNPVGDTMVLISTLFIALQVIAVQAWTKKYSPPLMATLQIATLGVLCAGCAFLSESPLLVPNHLPYWISVIVTSVLATFICFVIQATMQKRTTATKAGLIYMTEPLWGALFANVIGGEPIAFQTLSGGIILLAGMFVSEYPSIRGAWARYGKSQVTPRT